MELIPKVRPRFDEISIQGEWRCPGCGMENIVFLFSENAKQGKAELNQVLEVSCTECTRRFETD